MQVSMVVLGAVFAVVGFAVLRGVVRLLAQARPPAPAPAPSPQRTAREVLTAEVAALLTAAGVDPSTARVRHDPAAAEGLQWRVRVQRGTSWCFGSGSTAAAAVAELLSCSSAPPTGALTPTG